MHGADDINSLVDNETKSQQVSLQKGRKMATLSSEYLVFCLVLGIILSEYCLLFREISKNSSVNYWIGSIHVPLTLLVKLFDHVMETIISMYQLLEFVLVTVHGKSNIQVFCSSVMFSVGFAALIFVIFIELGIEPFEWEETDSDSDDNEPSTRNEINNSDTDSESQEDETNNNHEEQQEYTEHETIHANTNSNNEWQQVTCQKPTTTTTNIRQVTTLQEPVQHVVDITCSICAVNGKNRVLTCGHAYCISCVDMFHNKTCPYCRVPYQKSIPLFL
jgi:hypothetical protein